MEPNTHKTTSVIRKLCIGFILASGLVAAPPQAAPTAPPEDLARIVAEREAANAEALSNYTYRQFVQIQDFNRKGRPGGLYEETRDITFSPKTGRGEEFVKGPTNSLKYLTLTEEDFQDIREVQPFLFTAEQLWLYDTRYRGIEIIDGVSYYILEVRPRQVFRGMRYFEGTLWIHPEDLAVARSEGKAVPSVVGSESENLFPRFTTIRQKIDGQHWFPVHTHADDLLPFRTGPTRIRMTVRYSDYRRFAADSTITFDPEP